MITVNIANLPIGIDNKYEHVAIQAREYFTAQEPLFTVSVSEEDIDVEKTLSGTDHPRGYYESIIAYRKIANRLPEYDAFLFHGCVIEYRGEAYIITANSGVGKTTHTRLWLSEFGNDVSIINGDKPTVRIIDGVAYAAGTPWKGKEGYGRNVMKQIRGIVFLARAEKNRASKISTEDAVTRFMSQIYLPRKNLQAMTKTMHLADKVIRSVKLVELECNMNPEAARVCRAALVEND